MSEMVERVARAMALKANGGDWDTHYTADQRNLWRLRIRTAMDALRDPTNEMVNAACSPNRMLAFGMTSVEAREIWQAMIDEALR